MPSRASLSLVPVVLNSDQQSSSISSRNLTRSVSSKSRSAAAPSSMICCLVFVIYASLDDVSLRLHDFAVDRQFGADFLDVKLRAVFGFHFLGFDEQLGVQLVSLAVVVHFCLLALHLQVRRLHLHVGLDLLDLDLNKLLIDVW